MQGGNLGVDDRPTTIFIFDGLIAELIHPTAAKIAIATHRWDAVLDAWQFDERVCNYMRLLTDVQLVPVDVFTWQPRGFASALADYLWDIEVHVSEVKSRDYAFASQWVATNEAVTTVYDPDPNHRFGYGFKCREFSVSNR